MTLQDVQLIYDLPFLAEAEDHGSRITDHAWEFPAMVEAAAPAAALRTYDQERFLREGATQPAEVWAALQALILFQERLDFILDVPELIAHFLNRAQLIPGVGALQLLLVDEETLEFVPERTTPEVAQGAWQQQMEALIDAGLFGEIVNQRQPVVVPAQPELPAPGPTLLLTPLTVPQETLGLLSLALVDPVEAVSPATLCLLYLICKQFALTLRNMRLYEGLLAQNRELQIAQYDLHQKIVQLEQTREHLSTSLWELELKTRELEALKSELEERVRQRTQELEEANLALERMARTDGLTGLTNRGTFEDLLEMENRRVQRYHRTASVVMIDVNGLKQVNDCQGHIAGDRLIQAAAEVLRETCRRSDVVARYGGDEFVLLLPETAAPQVPKLIARLDQSIADWNAAQSDPGFTLSLSIGYADADECGDLHAALKQADARMYEEKRRRYAALSRQSAK